MRNPKNARRTSPYEKWEMLVQILHGSIINNYKNGQAKSGQRKRKNKKGAVRMVKKMMTNVFAVFVIFIVLAIIIPLPTPILDFLLIINIGLSLVILLMTMYIKKRLNFRYSRLYFF